MNNYISLIGLAFSFGAILDEDHDYAFQKSPSHARSLIVIKWIVVAFLLTTSYKSILLALMTNVYYEQTVDNIDEMVASGRTLWVASDTAIPFLLASDPRDKVQQMAKGAKSYKQGRGTWEDLKDVHMG